MQDKTTGKCYALKCFTKAQKECADASSNSSSVKYLEKKCPVELMERVDEEAMGAFLAADEDLSTVATDEELNETITDEWGVKYSKDERKLLKAPYELNGTYSIRKGTKIICDRAFYDCTSLTDIVIPDSVAIIGDHAFVNCSFPYDLKQELISRFRDRIFKQLYGGLYYYGE